MLSATQANLAAISIFSLFRQGLEKAMLSEIEQENKNVSCAT